MLGRGFYGISPHYLEGNSMKVNHAMVSTAVALAASVLAFSAPASAAVVIDLQEAGVNGGAITQEATGATNASFSGSYGVFGINSLSGQALPLPDILNSSAIDSTSTGAGTLNVFVTETGLTAPLGSNVTFNSGFTANEVPSGWTVTEQTYLINSSDVNVPLGSYLFSADGAQVQFDNAATGAGPYSVVEEYTVNATGAGSSSGTIDVSAVPEPATWAMFLVGFGAMGFMMRGSRRKQAAVLA
jgi:hypothetical protein